MLKDKVELFLNTYASNHPGVTLTVAKKSTGVYKNGIYQMCIYYRSDAIRVSVKPDTTQFGEYASLLRDHLVYQKDSANPYEPNSFAFFVHENDIATVLQRLLESKTLPTDGQMAEFAAHAKQYKVNRQSCQVKSERTVPVDQISNSSTVTIEVLKSLSNKALSALFKEWLAASGFSPASIPTNVSDCFYLWRKEGPEQFWKAVESDEDTAYSIMYEALRKYSATEPENVIRGYCRQIQRFRDFVASGYGTNWSVSEATGVMQQSVLKTAPKELSQLVHTALPQSGVRDNQRIEMKLDTLLSAITTMYSDKTPEQETKESQPEALDKRYRIEAMHGNTNVLMLKGKPSITGLIFSIKLYALGLESIPEQCQVFFTSQAGEELSVPQEISVVAGEAYSCRFELKSSASEEKVVYLAVRSVNADPDEVRQLIEIPVKIAFAADFGL